MRSAGLQAHAQQRRLRQRALDLEVGGRVLGSIRVRVHGHEHPLAPVAADRRLDRAAARRRPALDEREVLARDLARGELRLQRAVHVVVLGDDQQPARVAVQAMDDPRPPGLLAAAGAPGQRLRERALAMPARRVHDDARGLVDDDQMLVLQSDGELRHRSVRAQLLDVLGSVVDRDMLAAGDAVVLAHGRTVDEHPTGDDHALCARARAQPLREQHVEPLAGGLRRELELAHHARSPPAARRRRS